MPDLAELEAAIARLEKRQEIMDAEIRSLRRQAGLPAATQEIVFTAPTSDARVEPEPISSAPRARRPSAPVLAAHVDATQHFVRAREELDAGIDAMGEAARRVVSMDAEDRVPGGDDEEA